MNGSFLRFYVHENHRHHGKPVWEWLLKAGADLGLRGGSAFKAMAGFGRHHVLHEQTFFKLAGTVAIEVEFIVTEEEERELLERVRMQRIRLFYTRSPAQFAVINPDTEDDPAQSGAESNTGKVDP